LENSQRENGTTSTEVPFFPDIFQWNEPKNHVPFTTQPEFPESLGKWKTPKVREKRTRQGLELPPSNQTQHAGFISDFQKILFLS